MDKNFTPSGEEILDARKEFKIFFTKIRGKLKLSPEMESILWLHLKAIKCDEVEKFKDGIENFGYKI